MCQTSHMTTSACGTRDTSMAFGRDCGCEVETSLPGLTAGLDGDAGEVWCLGCGAAYLLAWGWVLCNSDVGSQAN